tara:strand:- start:1884 stop:2432 length:549 start_codon:yes stop_codon:yes gene_type:complete
MPAPGGDGAAGGAATSTKAITRLNTIDPHLVLMMRDVMDAADTAKRLNVSSGASGGGGGGGGAASAGSGANAGDGSAGDPGVAKSNCVVNSNGKGGGAGGSGVSSGINNTTPAANNLARGGSGGGGAGGNGGVIVLITTTGTIGGTVDCPLGSGGASPTGDLTMQGVAGANGDAGKVIHIQI